jgi:apolipoprotein D and lipocalin family protein
MMKRSTRGSLLALAVLLASAFMVVGGLTSADDNQQPPTVVDSVDLNAYQGEWREVAAIPMFFQRKCVKNTYAKYNLLENGKVSVENRCTKDDGDEIGANGRAWPEDGSNNAKLKVTFVSLFGWWLPFISGDYWIMDLQGEAETGYDIALVGSPDRKYGWILARNANLSDETLATLANTLKTKGYDTCQLKMTLQDTGRNPKEAYLPLCEVTGSAVSSDAN